ncbi:MAG: four helix bundle protein [Ignavibacteriales bacterium]|nr:four helix bundle protein [Ignavibacteriales bacterium]
MINHFSELVIWQKSRSLYVRLYRLLENSRDYSFKDQILRAALSISNNIAEGFGRN